MTLSDQLIRDAFSNGWHTCVYQPKVEPSFEKIQGVEALFRLDIPGQGIYLPSRFIERAFELGYEEAIFFIVLEQSLKDVKGIGANIGLAINISHQVLVNPENIERVRELLWEFSFPASRLTFELSESEELDESVAPQIDAFQQMGIKISIDDFGSGYSNFNKVLSLNIDEIKFDRSIINNYEMRSAALIKNILQFCRDFGITSVAEGVEDSDTRIYIRNLGFDTYQGFHFSKPVRIHELRQIAA